MEFWFLYAIAFYVLMAVANYLVLFQRLLKLPLQCPRYQLKPAEEFPSYLNDLYQRPIQQLEALGFQNGQFVKIASMLSVRGSESWGMLFYHPDSKSFATVTIWRPLEPARLFDIDFYTFFKDRSLLLTMNGKAHGLIGEIPNTIVQDPFAAALETHWQTHQDRLTQLKEAKVPCGLAPASFLKAIEGTFKAHIDHLVKTKQIAPIPGTSLFQLSWRMALQVAITIRRGNSKVLAMMKQRLEQAKADPSPQPEIPVQLEVDAFHFNQQIEQGHGKQKLGIWLLLASLVLFTASFTPFFEIQSLLLLIGVLFLHELGHYLAMRLFRYQDMSMFFLPFFGAAVTGRKDDASLSEKVWVLLAGPLPGLLLGIGLAMSTRSAAIPDYAREGIWMLIGINLFNLLPIFPLDGGKIANLLLFSRFPYTDVLFKLFAVVVLVLLGMGSPFVWAIAVIVALTIPAGFRSAKVDAKLRKQKTLVAVTDPDTLLATIFKSLRETGYGALPFTQRYSLAKDLLQRHRESHAGWLTRVSLSLLYSVSLLGGLVGSLQAISPQWQRLLTHGLIGQDRIYKQEVERATSALKANPKDTQAYIQRGRMRVVIRDYDGAIADANAVIRLQPNSSEGYSLRSIVRYARGDVTGGEADSKKANIISHTKAVAQANQTLKKTPNDLASYFKRAEAHRMLKNFKAALQDYNRVLRLNPKHTWAYLSRGDVRFALQDYKGAIADTSQVIQLEANPPKAYLLYRAYTLRSDAYQQLGNQRLAMADRQKAATFYHAADTDEP